MRFERHHSALIVASVITVASFVGATIYTQNRLARLDALSSTIETNAVPSTEYLSRAAVRLTRLNQLLDDAAAPAGRTAALAAARRETDALQADIGQYVDLTPLPGEAGSWSAIRTDVGTAIDLVRGEIEQQQRPAGTPLDPAVADRVDDALDRAVRTVLTALDFDVHQSERMARDVRDVRLKTLRMTIALDALATAIAVLAVLIAYRASRRHDQLLNEHGALLAGRVTELDRFAGRVAHDVLSPLNTIAAALPLLARGGDANAATYVERSQRALDRVQQLVEGLLTFARAGVRRDGASRCALAPVLTSIAADCADAASQQGIALSVDAPDPLEVACSAGVLASIVQNLVRNAIKYMGAAPVRRIVVRARAAGAAARVEVEDSGPGVPPELQRAIFEPFVRGTHDGIAGTGLGLATVKRLVESHGGTVVVQPAQGTGSVFRVELPLAVSGTAAARDAAHGATL